MRMIPDNMMDDDEKGKLFVGGLSWETTHDNLQRFFQRFGDVIDCVVMKNNDSGRSRGFGFVTFADPSHVSLVLNNGPHQLDGRTIDPKPCNPRTLQKPKKGGGYPKVFLGGLPSNVTETDLRSFFSHYGKVMEVVIMYDQEKKKSRGFGFLSFEDDASVERVTREHYINLNGKQVEIKKAEPRDGSGGSKGQNDNGQWGQPQGAPMGMMQGPNGQIGGPPMNMAMGAPNMMPSYQAAAWGTSQQQGYGYSANAPASYPNWGAPPGPQQWNNYPAAQQQPNYNNYDMYNSSTGQGGASSGATWNSWMAQQNSSGTAGTGGDMYSRGQSGAGAPAGAGPGMPPSGPGGMNSTKSASDYSSYGGYGNYSNDQPSSYGPRSYGNIGASQQSGYGAPQEDEFLKQQY
ncbi:heterogeneous nuclear ribonucleoprotein 27C-like isoform X2 [Bradysia coprophila]|uniref:heterogeneous nuclear ribonucleoprotein 27C-like isoform X2 n=1 Tax=Bradysia coprophila TaxID=38358 RepID=UPI00187DB1CB|nr:heterogeneous nuclear ribonucleoprotein 27C-like isoform X2 [Bradysia coprophila]